MRRPSRGGGDSSGGNRGASADQRLAGWVGRLLERYPSLPKLLLGLVIALILAGLLLSSF